MSFNLPADVEKYLKKFGSDKYRLLSVPPKKFKMAVVIPAICEYDNFLLLEKSLLENDCENINEVIVIVVVNNSNSASAEIKKDNAKLIGHLKKDIPRKLQFSLIDASSPGNEFDEKDAGVGLARKTGMDEALRIFDYNSAGENILVCLDADCIVEKNYFSAIFKAFSGGRMSAGYVNFEHQQASSEMNQRAILCYEIFMRYYVLGLKYAGSPYAFDTVGSTIVCNYNSYIKIQGMNKRKAAEDFYFLEKLAKTAEIKRISETTVFPSPRTSFRVPFGTGKGVHKFLNEDSNHYLLYNPEIFEILKKWNSTFLGSKTETAEYYMEQAEKINPMLKVFLEINNFSSSWIKIVKTSPDSEQISKQKRFWFDGLRTLKLVHYLRDNSLGNINTFSALDEMFKKCGMVKIPRNIETDIPDISIQTEYLNKLKDFA